MTVKKKIIIALIIAALLIGTAITYTILTEKCSYERVSTTVSDKCYTAAWTQTVWNGKTYSFIYWPEQYDVTLQYGKYTDAIDNKDVYDAYQNGDQVTAYLKHVYGSDNELKRTTLVYRNNQE